MALFNLTIHSYDEIFYYLVNVGILLVFQLLLHPHLNYPIVFLTQWDNLSFSNKNYIAPVPPQVGQVLTEALSAKPSNNSS